MEELVNARLPGFVKYLTFYYMFPRLELTGKSSDKGYNRMLNDTPVK